MPTSTLTSEGQVILPKEVRERLSLSEGDRIEFVFDDQGRVILRPESQGTVERLAGRLKHLALERPVTIEEMREAVLERARQKYVGRSDR
jgi:AbrB family looped-hinge helix DNA binding protein